MAKKAFRFGVVTGGHPSRSAWMTLAQRVEELGYSTLLVPDVLGTPLATITALAVAAIATTSLRVGSYVFVNDYRHPALLAREIATLDQLSDGRVELGLGAGNWPRDYQQLGIPFDKAGTRVSRFAEGLSIIKQFFTTETVDFSGKYYTATALRPVPRPVQQPHPPILIGSSGRRMLTLAAREANIIMPVSVDPTDAPLEEKIGWIREAAGERFEHLEFSRNEFGIELTDNPITAGPLTQGGIPVQSRPMTTAQAVEYLLEQRERLGISYIQIQERQSENFAPVVAHLNGK
ncbi:LLM class F420-dependent oxidoreductase [Ktedonobacter sp. SOSP1-85]|uniref:TIGR03621 family F420-dependent LLM class oxidoreductase n=1 Tax=Ktedonobacter sp. SOSP1-85 TaxID=2778367 RepID=UPI0019155384|nr:TIGR03621 family F420-dependent LLM class oxidoreductase [Ktedonobacter sp. SOSP1-85]GHO79993.1 LLM class F420-dependent oxidoreductase [Ktedonobacter sp. SOSP1-85]